MRFKTISFVFPLFSAVMFCLVAKDSRGWDLSTLPLGNIIVDEAGGYSRAELNRMLDELERATADQPFIVTRTKWISAMFRHVRLSVDDGGKFVHWHCDGDLLPGRCFSRVLRYARQGKIDRRAGLWVDQTGSAWVARLDTSHTCPDWESILSLGIRGLAERARKRRGSVDSDEERLFLDCVVEVYEAVSGLCLRWAELAERHGQSEVAEVLRALSEREPRTLREALQLGLLYDRCQETEGECVRSQGLFDRIYLRYYEEDVRSGRETRQSAKKLIAEWFSCFTRQNHPQGKNIAFGGYDRFGRAVWNDLTTIGFELHDERNCSVPKLTFRYGLKTPDWQLKRVASCIARGRNSVVFAVEESLHRLFLRHGKDPEDIPGYVLVGCYEPGIGGREIVSSMAAEINLAKPLEAVFNDGCDFRGVRIGPRCDIPSDTEGFVKEYLRQIDNIITEALDSVRSVESMWYELNPSPLMSGQFRDCIENARDCALGGCRYNQSGIMCCGLGTVADSLAAIRYLVDERKTVTMRGLGDILRRNWKGHENVRLAAKNKAGKWGNNDPRADKPGRRVYAAVANRINSAANGHGGRYQAGFWSIDHDLPFGRHTGATPDGRYSGDTLSRNNVPTAGCGKGGATALALSCATLDQTLSPNGFILDVILPVGKSPADVGARKISGFLRAVAGMGGQSVHFNVFDVGILRAARNNPERYEDLQVRVCGWNVRWNDLSREEQDHFIRTLEAEE